MAHSNPTVTAGMTASSAELDNACGDSSSHGGGAPFGQKWRGGYGDGSVRGSEGRDVVAHREL